MPGKELAKNQSVVGLVLAAGFSRRFGADKRRARLNSGQPLLAASLALPCAQLEEVWVVLRPEDDAEALGVLAGVRIVRSESAVHGMGHSLASGIQAIERQAQAAAVAVFLGDMPWIKMNSLGYLLALASPEHIVVPTFQGQPGHPVIFGRRFWPELRQLTGDSGAKALLQKHAQLVRRLELGDTGILRDIDTPQCMSESPLIL
nr:nucleotidyltransferase family protein [uncultured Pseudomonas sp.]